MNNTIKIKRRITQLDILSFVENGLNTPIINQYNI